jgi:hypothetical protein
MTPSLEDELFARVAMVLSDLLVEGHDVGAIAVASADAAGTFAGFVLAGSEDLAGIEGAAEGLSAIYAGQLQIALARTIQLRSQCDGA